MVAFNQQLMALSNFQTGVLVFPADSIPDPKYQVAFNDKKRLECRGVPLEVEKLTLAEQAYVMQLKHEMGSYVESLPSNGNTIASTQAFPAEPGGPVISNAPTGQAAIRRRPGEDLPPVAPTVPNAPTGPAAMRKRPGEDLPSAPSKKARSSTIGSKFRLIEEVRHFDFADLCAQVVKKYPTHFGTCELYVTDYTENKDVYLYRPPEDVTERERDGDTYGYTGPPKKDWPGPWGQLVLKINVKDPHAHYANREVNEGDFVLLRNVKMKIMAEGSKLEGDMWPDHLNPEKVQIVKMRRPDPPEVKAVLDRKERYWAARGRKAAAREQQGEKKTLTKTEKKKQKRLRNAEKAAAATEHQGLQNGDEVRNGATDPRSKADVNPHVRCSHNEIPMYNIRGILDLDNKRHTNVMPDSRTYVMPFISAKYRARFRVVDFSPKSLVDFALPELTDDEGKSENSLDMDWESSPKYEWSFSLQLEDPSGPKGSNDAGDRMWVNIGHEEAQYLFGNDMDDPVDLRGAPQMVAKLREKLFMLWGNLEEKTEEDPISNRAFECCLMEYGVSMDDDDPESALSLFGFKRMYMMFGVTLL